MRSSILALAPLAVFGLTACQTTENGQASGEVSSVPSAPASPSAGATTGTGTTSDTGGPTSSGTTGTGSGSTGSTGTVGGTTPTQPSGSPGVPTLISVNLQNVLNNLSVSLSVDRNSIPVTAQVPIDVAAAVCGVSVDALAASVASGRGTCTATTTSAQLNQVVQQQISTGGDVQGGDQTLNTSDK